MSIEKIRISAAEQRRLDECSIEPIRTPGSVQPHGALIAVDAETFEIVTVSDNTLELLGFEPVSLLGLNLADVVGTGPLSQLREILDPGSAAANPGLIAIGGNPFDAVVHRSADLFIVDFEPTLVQTEAQSIATLFDSIHRLALTETTAELWAATAREVRRMTLFDRVMVYRFHPDAHGEVVAEERVADMEPYLGLHYPASDIPAQARELYLSQLSRGIASSAGDAATLIGIDGRPSIDLSHSELRSVSPHHLQFMRNMGQASTLSFSLIHNGELIGMVTCAHRTPRRIPFVVRKGLEVLVNQVALQLSSISSIDRLTRQMAVRQVRVELVHSLTPQIGIPQALLSGETSMLDFIPADGAVVRLGGTVTTTGSVPPSHELEPLIATLRAQETGFAFATDSMALDHPQLASLAPSVTGIVVVPIGGEGDYIAWFRDELVQSVEWLGDQTPGNRATPLSPRNSFSAWTQDVTGTSESWGDLEAEAAELGRDLDAVLFRRAESKLAQVALHDPLTGLPNRRLLMDRLDHALARYARGDEVALLFVDLDGFKSVNDTLGHEAGDAVLVRTANQILATVRVADTVARIGGDEFVVLCEDTTAEEANVVADRIVEAIRQPSLTGYAEAVLVTASVGITTANLSFGSADLLRQADAAMYRAKQAGRDQAAR